MGSEGSPEPIDFDFFAEDGDDFEKYGRNSRRHESPSLGTSSKSRPESAGSVRSAVSSRSSISVTIPSIAQSEAKDSYSDSSDEDNFKAKRKNQNPNSHPVQTNVNSKKNRANGDSKVGVSRNDGNSSYRLRPKTSKGPRVGRTRKDSSSSQGSATPKSNRSRSSSFSSKSENSDSYTSLSDSDSVTDVSPLQSPARSPTPTLHYNQDEFEDSFEKSNSKYRQANTRSSKTASGRRNKTKPGKESVRFAGITPNNHGNSSSARRDKQMDETEARELSRLLRAVLELEDTPHYSQLHSAHHSRKQRPLSAKKASASSGAQAMPHQRVNLSFSNDKVRQIDRENQRLLQKILKRPKSGSALTGIRRREDQPRLVSHSAICRQREQRKIEMENMKILERIESARASTTVQRNKQLQDHSKQMKYASQVSKAPVRPQSSRASDYAQSSKLSKGSSMVSLDSNASRISIRSAGSVMRPSSGRSMPPPPEGPRQAWDDRW